MFISYYWLAN